MCKSVFACTLCMLMVISSAQAATVAYDVDPSMLATSQSQFSPPHGTGTNAFADDWDSAAPDTGAGAPVGYGSDSFHGNVANGGATPADRYRTFRVGLRALFGGPVTIAQLSRISYQANKNAPATGVDWRVTIYTTPGDKGADPGDGAIGAGDIASWYRNRLQSFPQESDALVAPANTWNTFQTNTGANELNWFVNRPGFTAHNISWSEFTAGNVNRGANNWDYSGEEVMMIDFTLGANSGGGTAESLLDAVRLELTNGSIADINLGVPEPGSLALLSIAGLTLLRRRRSIA